MPAPGGSGPELGAMFCKRFSSTTQGSLRGQTLPQLAGRDTPPLSQTGRQWPSPWRRAGRDSSGTQERSPIHGGSSPLSDTVRSPHGRPGLIWFTGNPIPSHRSPSDDWEPSCSQGMLGSPGASGRALCSEGVSERQQLLSDTLTPFHSENGLGRASHPAMLSERDPKSLCLGPPPGCGHSCWHPRRDSLGLRSP